MIDEWIEEIKQHPQSELVGMILVHNGIVRATTRQGKPVKGMKLSYNAEKLKDVVREIKKRDGIVEVKVWINEGELKVGDDIMKVLVAGRIRPEVFPALQELVGKIKKEVVHEEEFF
jgi:molybdopterin synthase catalytic subunit